LIFSGKYGIINPSKILSYRKGQGMGHNRQGKIPIFNFRLTPDRREKLVKVADEAGCTLTDVLNALIDRGLQDPQKSENATDLAVKSGAFTVSKL